MPQLANESVCTGCSACYNSCKHDAIRMISNNEGFLIPDIDNSKCINCNLCERNCPIINPQANENRTDPETFAMWSNPDRKISSSGGAFSALARTIFSKRGVVFGAAFDSNFKCTHIEAHNLEELAPIRGSKYVQSDIGTSYTNAKKYLNNNQWVLYTGTPCQIAGLYAFLRKPYDKLITLDLVCHGVPSNEIFQTYLKKLKSSNSKIQQIDNFVFRRLNGWNISPSIITKNKSKSLYDIEALYMSAFNRSAIFRNCCYSCKYAKIPRIGDCTIADFWGIGRHGIPFKHDILKGVSLILSNNKKGDQIISEMDDIFIEKRTLAEALIENHNLNGPSKKPNNREFVIQAFLNENKSLTDIDKEFKLVDHSIKGIIKKYATKYHLLDFVKTMYNYYKMH